MNKKLFLEKIKKAQENNEKKNLLYTIVNVSFNTGKIAVVNLSTTNPIRHIIHYAIGCFKELVNSKVNKENTCQVKIFQHIKTAHINYLPEGIYQGLNPDFARDLTSTYKATGPESSVMSWDYGGVCNILGALQAFKYCTNKVGITPQEAKNLKKAILFVNNIRIDTKNDKNNDEPKAVIDSDTSEEGSDSDEPVAPQATGELSDKVNEMLKDDVIGISGTTKYHEHPVVLSVINLQNDFIHKVILQSLYDLLSRHYAINNHKASYQVKFVNNKVADIQSNHEKLINASEKKINYLIQNAKDLYLNITTINSNTTPELDASSLEALQVAMEFYQAIHKSANVELSDSFDNIVEEIINLRTASNYITVDGGILPSTSQQKNNDSNNDINSDSQEHIICLNKYDSKEQKEDKIHKMKKEELPYVINNTKVTDPSAIINTHNCPEVGLPILNAMNNLVSGIRALNNNKSLFTAITIKGHTIKMPIKDYFFKNKYFDEDTINAINYSISDIGNILKSIYNKVCIDVDSDSFTIIQLAVMASEIIEEKSKELNDNGIAELINASINTLNQINDILDSLNSNYNNSDSDSDEDATDNNDDLAKHYVNEINHLMKIWDADSEEINHDKISLDEEKVDKMYDIRKTVLGDIKEIRHLGYNDKQLEQLNDYLK